MSATFLLFGSLMIVLGIFLLWVNHKANSINGWTIMASTANILLGGTNLLRGLLPFGSDAYHVVGTINGILGGIFIVLFVIYIIKEFKAYPARRKAERESRAEYERLLAKLEADLGMTVEDHIALNKSLTDPLLELTGQIVEAYTGAVVPITAPYVGLIDGSRTYEVILDGYRIEDFTSNRITIQWDAIPPMSTVRMGFEPESVGGSDELAD